MEKQQLVSFIILAYEHEEYISEAIEGAFAQDYSNLEIIISDDGSKDSTFQNIQEAIKDYDGPHKILIRKNSANLGLGKHIQTVWKEARGEIIVLAAGDDISLPKRVSKLVKNFDSRTFALFSDVYVFKDNSSSMSKHRCWLPGLKLTLADILVGGGGVGFGAAYAYRKNCFSWPWEYPENIVNEDRILPLRAILLGDVKHIPEALVKYRRHTDSISQSENFVFALYNSAHQKEVEKTLLYARSSSESEEVNKYDYRGYLNKPLETKKSKKIKRNFFIKEYVTFRKGYKFYILAWFNRFEKVKSMLINYKVKAKI